MNDVPSNLQSGSWVSGGNSRMLANGVSLNSLGNNVLSASSDTGKNDKPNKFMKFFIRVTNSGSSNNNNQQNSNSSSSHQHTHQNHNNYKSESTFSKPTTSNYNNLHSDNNNMSSRSMNNMTLVNGGLGFNSSTNSSNLHSNYHNNYSISTSLATTATSNNRTTMSATNTSMHGPASHTLSDLSTSSSTSTPSSSGPSPEKHSSSFLWQNTLIYQNS